MTNVAATNALISVSCGSPDLCVATTFGNRLFASANPLALPSSWPPTDLPPGTSLAVSSCPSTTLCVLVDSFGKVVASGSPGAGAPAWSVTAGVDPNGPVALACAGNSLCVIGDGVGGVVASTAPLAGTWGARHVIDGTHGISGISCPSTSLCVAVDSNGSALVSTNPSGGVWSSPQSIDSTNFLAGISCPSTALCVAVDGHGNTIVSTNPAAGSWGPPQNIDGARNLIAISCGSVSLCAAIDGEGAALTATDPVSAAAGWTRTVIDPNYVPLSVSCPSVGLCVVVDNGANVVRGLGGPPTVSTGVASGVSTSAGTLNATVNPNGLPVSDCHFDLGPSAAYGAQVPCAQGPGAGSAAVAVSATLRSLTPQRSYHFRIVATSAGGTQQGSDQTFTTATPRPHLSSLRLNPKSFHALNKRRRHRPRTGTTISYSDSQPASTKLTILQSRRGVRSHGRCVAPPRHPHGKAKPHRCTRTVTLGSLSHRDAKPGIQRLHFDGRVHGHPLAAGSYTLTAIATDSAHRRSNTIRAGFRITR